jgi:DnaJ family protein C protein 28
MDFVDHRKSSETQTQSETTSSSRARRRGKKFNDYIEEIIHEAQERGEFDNLSGSGKPLNLEEDSAAGDNALAYRMLKNNGYAPAEVELTKEIQHERKRIEEKLAKAVQQGRLLRARRVALSANEKLAFNINATKTLADYEQTLRTLNRKILTLNLSAPTAMHQSLLPVEELVQQAHASCPLFE